MRSPTATLIRNAIDDAITAVMNKIGAARGCQPLCWSTMPALPPVLSGFAGAEHSDSERLAIAEQWAAAFDLAPTEDRSGYRTWTGPFEPPYELEVWAIIDRVTFEANLSV